MEDARRREIALFRYALIRPLLDDRLSSAERGRVVRDLAARPQPGPEGGWVQVARPTLYRWLKAYRDDGFAALVPAARSVAPVSDAELLDVAVRLKREAPERTAAHICELIAAELAAVIVEPFQRLIQPRAGFLEGLRALTARHGIPLVFDEVVTGFRFAYGGAQEYYGVVPDLAALGKVIGGGFPLAAVCGRRDIMEGFDPRREGTEGFVAQIGTLNGNPVAAVSGLATLAELRKPGTYERLRRIGGLLRDGLAERIRRGGLPAQVVGEAVLFDVVFTDRPVEDYRATLTADGAALRRFNEECLRGGVVKGTSKIYLSLAHDEADVERTLEVFEAALARAAAR